MNSIINYLKERTINYFSRDKILHLTYKTAYKIKTINIYFCKIYYIVFLFFIFILVNYIIVNPLIGNSENKFSYGEFPNFNYFGKNGTLPNQNGSIIPYETIIDKHFPYPVYDVNKLIYGPAIVLNGIVISKNTTLDDLSLNRFGYLNTLNINSYPGQNENISFFTIQGNNYDNYGGFISPSLNYSGRYISLNIGNIIKIPDSAQVSVQMDIKGERNTYNIIFVNGRLQFEGWINNTLYKNISNNSSQIVDFNNLISLKGDKFQYLDNIKIYIEKGTKVNSFPLRIDFGRSTINTPGIIHKDDPSYVNGFIFTDIPISNKYSYIFQNWKLLQDLNQEFEVNSSHNYKIASNGWNIKEAKLTKDIITNSSHIVLKTERYVQLDTLSIPDFLTHLDLYQSLLFFGSSKDFLFIILILSVILICFPMNVTSFNPLKKYKR